MLRDKNTAQKHTSKGVAQLPTESPNLYVPFVITARDHVALPVLRMESKEVSCGGIEPIRAPNRVIYAHTFIGKTKYDQFKQSNVLRVEAQALYRTHRIFVSQNSHRFGQVVMQVKNVHFAVLLHAWQVTT